MLEIIMLLLLIIILNYNDRQHFVHIVIENREMLATMVIMTAMFHNPPWSCFLRKLQNLTQSSSFIQVVLPEHCTALIQTPHCVIRARL